MPSTHVSASSRRGWPIALGVLGALGALGVLWFASAGRDRSARQSGKTSRRVADEVRDARAIGLVPSGAPEAFEAAGEREPLAAQSPSRFAIEAPLEPGTGIELRVVAGDPAQPVPEVLVAFVDERAILDVDLLELRAGTLTLEELLEKMGRRFQTDGNGRVWIPAPRGFGFVAGGTGELWGMLEFPESTTAPVLELEPDPPLVVRVVRVVNGVGTPAGGVPVALRRRYTGFVQDLFQTRSSHGTGRATLRHVQRFVEERRRKAQYYAALAMLAPGPIEVALDPGRTLTEPLELVLPPSGSVEVRIEDGAGRPFSSPVVVRLIDASTASTASVQDPAFERALRVHRVAKEGHLVVPHVGLGIDLAIRLDAQGFAPLRLDRRGPRSSGERVTVLAVLEDPVPSLTGIVTGTDGKALAQVDLASRLTLETAERKSERSHTRLRTDEEGRFRLALPPAWSELSGRLVLELGTDDDAHDALSTRVVLPGRPRDGEHDLGTLGLSPLPLIVAGVVVDVEGRPVAGAQVTLAVPRERGSDPASWRTISDHRTRSDRDGAFELRGRLDATLLGVSATHPRHSGSRPVEAAPGARGIRVVLEPAGRLVGRILLEEGVPGGLFTVTAQHEFQPASLYQVPVGENGFFEIASMDEGTYRVTAGLSDEEACAREFTGVRIRAGETTDDERVRNLDLRGLVRHFTIEVVDETGAPVMQGAVTRKSPEADEFEDGRIWIRGGRAEVVTCRPALDLEVDAPGHRIELLQGVAEDRRVVLARGPSVVLVLENAPLLGPDIRLGAQVRRAEPGRWRPTGTTWFEEGRAHLQVKSTGAHEVFVLYARLSGGATMSTQISSGPEARIEVADTISPQEFAIELAGSTLRRIEEL